MSGSQSGGEKKHFIKRESSLRNLNHDNSLGCTIPKPIAEALGLTQEDSIEIYVPKDDPEKAEIKKKPKKELEKIKVE